MPVKQTIATTFVFFFLIAVSPQSTRKWRWKPFETKNAQTLFPKIFTQRDEKTGICLDQCVLSFGVSARLYFFSISSRDLDKQGSAELYSDSGWDRGRAIYSELLRFTDRGVQETQSYAFILPMARRLNRVDWLEMEDVLVGHLATSFADNDGEILVFTGTSDMEAQIVSNNGKQMLKMTKGPEIYLGDEEEPTRIRIPNLIWTLVVSIHYARNSDSRPERIETIAYFGNNSEERSKAITIAIPFEIADKLLGVSALNDDAVRNLKIQHTEKNFTPILPMATE